MLKAIWGDAFSALKADAGLALAALVVSTAPMVYADLMLSEMDAFRMAGLISIALIPLQIAIIARALTVLGVKRAETTRTFFPRAFGQSLLTGLGLIVGLLLLIVPGLILALRWAVAMQALIAEDCGVIESLRRSWALTRGKAMVVLGAYAPAIVVMGVAMILVIVVEINLPSAIITETLFSAAFVLAWFLQTALYRALLNTGENPA